MKKYSIKSVLLSLLIMISIMVLSCDNDTSTVDTKEVSAPTTPFVAMFTLGVSIYPMDGQDIATSGMGTRISIRHNKIISNFSGIRIYATRGIPSNVEIITINDLEFENPNSPCVVGEYKYVTYFVKKLDISINKRWEPDVSYVLTANLIAEDGSTCVVPPAHFGLSY